MKKADPKDTTIPEYPHLLNNHPCGIDKFDSQSQCKLVNGIAEQIVNIDTSKNPYKLARIIGVDGGWGVGKSNVIKQLKSVIEEKYYVFEYDAWGHQEDLQRRSFLEALTRELIEKGILDGKVKTTIDGKQEKVSWQQKLNDLLARKIVRINKSLPKFNAGALWTALAIAITPFTVFVAERFESAQKIDSIVCLSLIAFCPILIGIGLWIIFMCFNKDMRSLGYLLKISKDENIETKNYETINEDEPNVFKFRTWMQDISDYIKENKKPRLIVVFDNMDRLPSNKVKELWSSIQTFFSSENGFENIWAIIPFDREHLARAFNDDAQNQGNEELTNHFIEKTFPIVYRVSPPIITDLRGMFDKLFIEAFGDTEKEHQETVNRLFRLSKPFPTIREIIIFINEIVSLKGIWKADIDVVSISLFILNKKEILTDPINQILSGNYLSDSIKKIVSNDQGLQRNISALVYCLDVDDAEQIPLTTYIQNSLVKSADYDINKYSTNKHFIPLLDDLIRDSDVAKIDDTIKALSSLVTDNFSARDKKLIDDLWNFLSDQKISIPLQKQEVENSHEVLLLKSDSTRKEKIVKYLISEVSSFSEFRGGAYFMALSRLEKILLNNNINVSLGHLNLGAKPDEFVEYMSEAQGDYKKYGLKINPQHLEEYLLSHVPDNISDIQVRAIQFIDKKEYPMPILLERVKASISQDVITTSNFKNILAIYKFLWRDDELFPIQFTTNQRNALIAGYTQQKDSLEYLDLVAMSISVNSPISEEFADEQITYMADNIEYYATFGSLLINCTLWNNPVLNQVLKHMTLNMKGYSLDIEKVLPKFFEIKNKLEVTEKDLLIYLSNWDEALSDANLNKTNIESIIPNAKFYGYSIELTNELTKYINSVAIAALSEINTDTLYIDRGSYNSDYWWQAIKHFLDTSYLSSLPENLTELGKLLLKGVASGDVTLPIVDLYQHVIDSVDGRRTIATIRDIRDSFCNGTNVITPTLFDFFEERLRSQGNLIERAGSVVRKILYLIINNQDSLNRILSNSSFYAGIINKAEDEADDFKTAIMNKIQTSDSEQLLSFAILIGISLPETKTEN